MIRWMRSANVRDGKVIEAIRWGKEIAGQAEKLGGLKVRVFVDAFGDVSTMRWSVDAPDLGTLEKALEKLFAAPEYFERVKQEVSAGIFVDTSTRDVVSREV